MYFSVSHKHASWLNRIAHNRALTLHITTDSLQKLSRTAL